MSRLARPSHPNARVWDRAITLLGFATVTKAELHDLVESLPEESLDAAAILLRRAQDPVLAKLEAAPYDDEPLRDDDRRAVLEATQEPALAWDEVAAELHAD